MLFQLKSIIKRTTAFIVLSIGVPFLISGNETDSFTDRLAYTAEYDPTTVFLINHEGLSNNAVLASDVIDYAKTFLGKPYRSGAKGPNAFDCSGFTSYVFKDFGINLNSSSSTQYLQGTTVDLEDVQPGDLIFFNGRQISKTRVGHVGMVISVDDNGCITFIHAACGGGVKTDTYPDNGYYSKRFIGTKRILE